MSKIYILSDKNANKYYLIRNSRIYIYRDSDSLLDYVLRNNLHNVMRRNIANLEHFERKLRKIVAPGYIGVADKDINGAKVTEDQAQRIFSLANEQKLEVKLPSGEVLDVHNCYKDAFGSAPNLPQAERFQKFLESLVKKASQSN